MEELSPKTKQTLIAYIHGRAIPPTTVHKPYKTKQNGKSRKYRRREREGFSPPSAFLPLPIAAIGKTYRSKNPVNTGS
jgi:hypothetical protein